MTTIRDVAALAKVSVATVSRVLNNKKYVNPDTEQKVLEAMKQLNYKPNSIARGLSGKKMNVIALIIPSIINPFFPELARGVEDIAHKHGYSVFLCNSDDQKSKEDSYIELLKSRSIDGIIFSSSQQDKEDIREFKNSKIPLVLMDRAVGTNGGSTVRANNKEGVKKAVEHLLQTGSSKIAHIYGPQNISTAKERLMMFEEIVSEYEWFTPTLMVPGDFSVEGGKEAIKTLMKRHPDIDGIFAGNDLMAIGALKQLHKLGIQVPEQITVCGFDGIQTTQMTHPEISTVAQPIYEMGKVAAKILINKIEGVTDDKVIHEFDVQLIKRESTARKIFSKTE